MRRALPLFISSTSGGPSYPPPQQGIPMQSFYPPPTMHHQHPPPPPPYGMPPPPSPPPSFMKPMRRPQLDPGAFILKVPRNKVVNIVPEGEVWVVERFGKFFTAMKPGLHYNLPLVDKIRYRYLLKEQGVLIPQQSAITRDNVMVDIDGVLYVRIVDPYKASYNIENPIYNILTIAQTTLRSELGKMALDKLFEERSQLNTNIINSLRKEAGEWGVECLRYEVRDVAVSDIVRRSMDLQAEAERRKRKSMLEAEGDAAAEESRAEGTKKAQRHLADAALYSTIKQAEGNAEAARIIARSQGDCISLISASLTDASGGLGHEAISMMLGKQYIDAFHAMAKEGTPIVVPHSAGDVANVTAQAVTIASTIMNADRQRRQQQQQQQQQQQGEVAELTSDFNEGSGNTSS